MPLSERATMSCISAIVACSKDISSNGLLGFPVSCQQPTDDQSSNTLGQRTEILSFIVSSYCKKSGGRAAEPCRV